MIEVTDEDAAVLEQELAEGFEVRLLQTTWHMLLAS